MLRPGQIIDRYEVETEIGRGGMAVVYRVRHRTLATVHAMKVLYVQTGAFWDRAVQEGRIQANLRHPNIVAVTDVLDIGGSPGLLMEYVDGVTLDQWLASHAVTVEEGLSLFRDIAAAVQAAHEVGLVHRDLKPGNVLITEVSGRHVPKVTDFGLAKVLDADTLPNATRTGATMGTPAYMAPEQVKNAKGVDQRADVFSLGAVLFRILCGQPPFENDDVLLVLQATREGRYPDPRTLRPELSDAVVEVIAAALQPDPEQRLSSAGALLDRLGGVGNVTWAPTGGAAPAAWKTPIQSSASWQSTATGRTPTPTAVPQSVWMGGQGMTIRDDDLQGVTPLPGAAAPSRRWRAVGVGAIVVGLLGLGVLLGSQLSGGAAPATEPPPEVTPSPPAAAAPTSLPTSPEAPGPTPPTAVEPATSTAVARSSTTSARKPEGSTTRTGVNGAAGSGSDLSQRPAASPGSIGQVSVAGDASAVWVENDTGRHTVSDESPVPAGSWTIGARFGEQEVPRAGRLILQGGDEMTVRCSSAFLKCTAARGGR